MKFVFWLILPLFTVLLATFAVSNREAVALGLWPLVHVLELPLYLVVLSALLLGFLLGEFIAWVSARHWRREVRRRGRRIDALERELAMTQAALERGEGAREGARTTLPAGE
jgi:uncharacterized integral membrane protein